MFCVTVIISLQMSHISYITDALCNMELLLKICNILSHLHENIVMAVNDCSVCIEEV